MSDPRKFNRFGTPEMTITHKSGAELSVTQCEAYADAAIQRAGLVSEGLPADHGEAQQVLMERVLPHVLAVLQDAGEVGHPVPPRTQFEPDGPEVAKMMLVGVAVGTILGCNKAYNERFGKGQWTL